MPPKPKTAKTQAPPKPKAAPTKKEPTLVVTPLKQTKDTGTQVQIKLKPNKPAPTIAYQTVTLKLGTDTYVYSEAWSLQGSKGVFDTFLVPENRRDELYYSVVSMWIEPAPMDKTYKTGTVGEQPWGKAFGKKHTRPIPSGVDVVERKTTLRWDKKGKMMKPVEKRNVYLRM